MSRILKTLPIITIIFLLTKGAVVSQEQIFPLHILTDAGSRPMEWSNDSQRLLVMTYYAGVYIIDTNQGEVLNHIEIPYVTHAVGNFDTSRIAVSRWTEPIGIWDAESGDPIITTAFRYVTVPEWQPHTNQLLINEVGLIDSDTGEIILDLDGMTSTWSQDGSKILAWNPDSVQIWDVEAREPIYTMPAGDREITGALWSPDESLLLMDFPNHGDAPPYAELWELASNNLITTIENAWRLSLWSYDGVYLLTEMPDDTLNIWRVSDGSLITTIPPHHRMNDVEWSPTNYQIMVSTLDDWVYVWDAETGELQHKLSTGFINDLPENGAKWLSSGAYIVQWATDGTIRFWDAQTGALSCLLQHKNADGTDHTYSAVNIALHEETQRLASGWSTINIWDYSSCVAG